MVFLQSTGQTERDMWKSYGMVSERWLWQVWNYLSNIQNPFDIPLYRLAHVPVSWNFMAYELIPEYNCVVFHALTTQIFPNVNWSANVSPPTSKHSWAFEQYQTGNNTPGMESLGYFWATLAGSRVLPGEILVAFRIPEV